jgi:hypothetical protein
MLRRCDDRQPTGSVSLAGRHFAAAHEQHAASVRTSGWHERICAGHVSPPAAARSIRRGVSSNPLATRRQAPESPTSSRKPTPSPPATLRRSVTTTAPRVAWLARRIKPTLPSPPSLPSWRRARRTRFPCEQGCSGGNERRSRRGRRSRVLTHPSCRVGTDEALARQAGTYHCALPIR